MYNLGDLVRIFYPDNKFFITPKVKESDNWEYGIITKIKKNNNLSFDPKENEKAIVYTVLRENKEIYTISDYLEKVDYD